MTGSTSLHAGHQGAKKSTATSFVSSRTVLRNVDPTNTTASLLKPALSLRLLSVPLPLPPPLALTAASPSTLPGTSCCWPQGCCPSPSRRCFCCCSLWCPRKLCRCCSSCCFGVRGGAGAVLVVSGKEPFKKERKKSASSIPVTATGGACPMSCRCFSCPPSDIRNVYFSMFCPTGMLSMPNAGGPSTAKLSNKPKLSMPSLRAKPNANRALRLCSLYSGRRTSSSSALPQRMSSSQSQRRKMAKGRFLANASIMCARPNSKANSGGP
mmetsp:Transcript_80441/g.160572  ORF Transcript_80441/g.160572 Transcript_80441/m.160572 type:complete len:268 (-) Transcript_80441:537-1340(-)